MRNFVRPIERPSRYFTILALIGLAACLGCDRTKKEAEPAEEAVEAKQAVDTPSKLRATAVMKATKGHTASGSVHFTEAEDGVVVRATITGLEPDSVHGFHIHETGDCSAPDATSAGGHYAPEGHPHGLPPAEARHAGDMGNLVADGEGRAEVERTFDNFSLQGEASVLGRAVILHAEADQGTQPTGGAGARIACGVIEEGGAN